MNKFEKIQAAVIGKKNRQLPFSFWTHLPEIDRDPVALAEATCQFFKKYDLDFIKTMNNGMYSIEDYHCEIDYSPIASGGVARLMHSPIKHADDLYQLPVISCQKGALARELESLQQLLTHIDGEAPIVFTLFSPLTTLHKLCGAEKFNLFLTQAPAAMHKALSTIAQSTGTLAQEAIKLGADGVFFAAQMGNYGVISELDYAALGIPYDFQVLEQAKGGWFNILHAHGDNIMFPLLKNYPVQVLNWHIGESPPTIAEARSISDKCLLGGLQRMDITHGNKAAIKQQIQHAIDAVNKQGHILSPGCVIRHPLNDESLFYIKQIKTELEQTADKQL